MIRFLPLLAAVLLLAGCSQNDDIPTGPAGDPVAEALYAESAENVLALAGPDHTTVNPLEGLWLNAMKTGTWLIQDRIFAWYPPGYSPFDRYTIFVAASHRAGDSVWVAGLLRDRSVSMTLTGAIDDSTITCDARFTFQDSSTVDESFTLKLTDPDTAQN